VPLENVFVGIDVSKEWLDVATRPGNAASAVRVGNDEEGIGRLVELFKTVQPQLVVLEATGGLQAPVAAALAVAGFAVAVVNPRQVRDFARATGKLAKTDAIDAAVLAHFAAALQPEPRPLPDAQAIELEALLARRRQLIEMITAESNRRARCTSVMVRKQIDEHIAWLRKQLRAVDGDLDTAVKASPLWREKEQLLRSAPGIGASWRSRCSRSFQSSAGSIASRSRRWSELRRSTATAATPKVDARFGEGGLPSEQRSTWPRWSLHAEIRS